MNEESNGNDRITSDAKLLLVVETLAGREFAPMRLGEIADATGLPPATVLAKINCLAENQWVEKVGEAYRLGVGILSLAHKFYSGAQDHARRMQEEFKNLIGGTERVE